MPGKQLSGLKGQEQNEQVLRNEFSAWLVLGLYPHILEQRPWWTVNEGNNKDHDIPDTSNHF